MTDEYASIGFVTFLFAPITGIVLLAKNKKDAEDPTQNQ
jgi:hypothetical protein